MTTRTVIAALGLAILLGGIAWLIVGGKGGGSGPAALGVGDLIVDIDGFSANYVRVRHPDGRVEEARRESINAPWLLTITRPGGAAKPPAWTVQPTRMTNFLRVVQNCPTRAVPEAGSTIGKDPVVLELPAKKPAGAAADAEPGVVTIRFGNKRLGGNVLAEVIDPSRGGGEASGGGEPEPYLAVISDDLLDAVTQPGMSGWRETSVMPDAGQLASRLTFTRPDTSFTVARVNGRWRVTAPFGAPADQEQIPQILRALESVRIVDFLDARQPTAAEAGLEEPMAQVTLVSDRPDGVLTRSLLIGAPVPGQPGQVYARLGDPPSPHIVRIDAAALTSLPGSAVALVNRAATSVPVTEIFNLALARLEASGPDMVFRKEQQRWGEVASSEQVLALDDAGAAQIGELLQFLTAVAPESISTTAPEAFMPLGTLKVASLGGSPLDELTIGVAPTDKSVSIVLLSRAPGAAAAASSTADDASDAATPAAESAGTGARSSGGVYRIYAEGRTPLLLRRFLSGEAFEPITPPDQTSDPTGK